MKPMTLNAVEHSRRRQRRPVLMLILLFYCLSFSERSDGSGDEADAEAGSTASSEDDDDSTVDDEDDNDGFVKEFENGEVCQLLCKNLFCYCKLILKLLLYISFGGMDNVGLESAFKIVVYGLTHTEISYLNITLC